MKQKNSFSKTKILTVLGICSFLIVQSANSFAGSVKKDPPATTGEEEPAGKSKAKTKAFASLNNEAVKIYPDALKREMHVIAKGNEGKEIDFFVFDLQGTLVQNYKMKAKDHNRISGLARGTYIYRVFCGDEETAAGKFDIR